MDAYRFTHSIWPVLAASSITAILAGYCWRRRAVPGALSLAAAMALFLPLTLGQALELTAVAPSTRMFWHTFQALWLLPTLTAVLVFALQFANLDRWMTRRRIALLSAPAVAAAVAMATNPIHHLIWASDMSEGPIPPLSGDGRWVLYGYAFALAVAITAVFVWLFVTSPLHRAPVAVCLLGHLAARVGGILDVRGINPFQPVDATVLGGTVAAAMYVVALFGFKLFDIIPVARRTVLEQMREAMLVLDTSERIVDCNRAAESILGQPAGDLRGRHAGEVLRAAASGLEPLGDVLSDHAVIQMANGPSHGFFALHASPLTDRLGRPLGRLILVRDVTEERRAQVQALEQQRAIAVLQERDRVARELHDSIGQVMGYVKMQVQAARTLLKKRPDEAEAYLAQAVAVVQDAHADVREYILGATIGRSAEVDCIGALRKYLGHFGDQYGIKTSLRAASGLDDQILEPTTEVQLLRIIQEALTNVRKHGRARSASVALDVGDGRVRAVVADDGRGFDPADVNWGEGGRFGLRFMRERADEVGGDVEVDSTPGGGTRVIISMPIRKDRS